MDGYKSLSGRIQENPKRKLKFHISGSCKSLGGRPMHAPKYSKPYLKSRQMTRNTDGYPVLRNSLSITYGVKQIAVDNNEVPGL